MYQVLTDKSPMPFGIYKGRAMANVPDWYLLSLYENNKCNGNVKQYIINNLDSLKNDKK